MSVGGLFEGATVVVTRPTPGVIDVPGARIVTGPDHPMDPDELRGLLRDAGGVDALVSMFHDRIDGAALGAAGDCLKVVANFAVGYDNIDVPACGARSVAVGNTPDAVTEGTADLAWALLLSASRRLHEAGVHVRHGGYCRRGPLGMGDFLGLDIAGKTLLIVGAGRIGYATALRSIGWGMRVLYSARSRHAEFEHAPLNAERVDLDSGLVQADFVSVHTPLVPETRHLLDARRIGLMKRTAVVVNTARGPVIEESALVAALQEGRLYAAGLDVYEFEPELAKGLASLPNAVLTPHLGSASVGCRARMASMVSANVRAALQGHPLPHGVGF